MAEHHPAVMALLAQCEERDGCLVWTRSLTNSGYAFGYLRGMGSGPLHRLVFVAIHGLPPVGTVVRHICDNRPCIAPAHLVVGSQSDNLRDAVARGRHVAIRGEFNVQAVLTNAQITEMRARHAAGERQRDLAVHFGVKPYYVSKVVNMKARAHG